MTGLTWLSIVAVCCASVVTGFEVVQNDPGMSEFALKWLQSYGYLQTDPGLVNVDSVNSAVSLMQQFYQLSETGKVDSETLRVMQMPRCGVPDFVPGAQAGEEAKKFKTTEYNWSGNNLYYMFENHGSQLTSADVESDLAAAFQKWSDICGMGFTKTPGSATIKIKFSANNNHGDSPFDRALAHAFYPSYNPNTGDIHFNELYTFKKSGTASSGNYDLSFVALHEIGHSIGLGHSSTSSAIMAPTYNEAYANNAQLQPDDIAGARKLYGN